MCRSITSLSKITHQMRRNHSFSQRNKTKGAVGLEVGGDREGGRGVGQNLKNGGREYRRVFIK